MKSSRLLFTTPLLALLAGACGSSPLGMGGGGDTGGATTDGQGGIGASGQGGAASPGGVGGGPNGGPGGATGTGGATACVPPAGGVTTGGQTQFHYGVNYAWASFGSDFGNTRRGVAATKAARITSLMDMKAHGVDVVRWWVFPNFQGGGVNFDATTGAPTGLGGTTTADIDAALDAAAQAGVRIEFTLFSFDSFKINVATNTVNPHNLAPLISDATLLTALINNVVVPFVQQVSQSPNKDRVSSWDVINEPEWAIAANPTDGADAAFTPQTTVTTVQYPVMLAFVKRVADTIHAGNGSPVTVGGAAIKWAKAWASVGDFYTFHMYDWVNQSYPYTKSLASYGVTDKPVVLGEFPIQGLTGVPYLTLVDTIYRLGYAGALPWAYNDAAFPWAPNNPNVKSFADSHPCMFLAR